MEWETVARNAVRSLDKDWNRNFGVDRRPLLPAKYRREPVYLFYDGIIYAERGNSALEKYVLFSARANEYYMSFGSPGKAPVLIKGYSPQIDQIKELTEDAVFIYPVSFDWCFIYSNELGDCWFVDSMVSQSKSS